MVRAMDEAGADDISDEVAAMAVLARDLMDRGDRPAEVRDMSEAERVNALRLTLSGVADIKQRRLRLQVEQRMYITVDDFRMFLADLFAVLRRHIQDDDLLRDVAADVGSLRAGAGRRPQP